jgi:hypothetical protein
MSAALVLASKAAGVAFSYLKAMLDPGLRRKLDEEIANHVLSEIPRILRILEARIQDVSASGCTIQEANIIAHQVIEAQQRTLEEEKRRRLSNVLINGLCSPRWDKAKLRLLIRLTSELEEEHIALLQWYAATPDVRKALDAKRNDPWVRIETSPGVWQLRPTPEQEQRWAFQDALTRELVSRALLLETPTPQIVRPIGEDEESRRAVEEIELEWDNDIAPLGLDLLAHLQEPEEGTGR